MDANPLINHINERISLSEEEEALILARSKSRTYLKGQYIQQGGDVSKFQNFVVSGCVKTFYLDRDGNEHVVGIGIEDWWVGDVSSFTTQSEADFHTQCLENTTVIQISFDDQEELFKEVPKLERYFRLVIQKAYGNMSMRNVQNHSMTAKERYLLFLETYPDIVQRAPQYVIASYLGITKEFLSNIRNQMSKS